MRKNDHKTYINTLGVPHCHIAMGIFVHVALNWTPWHLVPWPLEHNCPNQSDKTIHKTYINTLDCKSLSTSPLFALFTCCWMSFEAVLGNKEFEFVVSEVTLTVVTWHSTSGGHGHRVSNDQGHVFFAKYILNLPYIYSIFSIKKKSCFTI